MGCLRIRCQFLTLSLDRNHVCSFLRICSFSLSHVQSKFDQTYQQMRKKLKQSMALCEAIIDFSEDGSMDDRQIWNQGMGSSILVYGAFSIDLYPRELALLSFRQSSIISSISNRLSMSNCLNHNDARKSPWVSRSLSTALQTSGKVLFLTTWVCIKTTYLSRPWCSLLTILISQSRGCHRIPLSRYHSRHNRTVHRLP
jgi:hypothetical protein